MGWSGALPMFAKFGGFSDGSTYARRCGDTADTP